jgi:hypothetical protein
LNVLKLRGEKINRDRDQSGEASFHRAAMSKDGVLDAVRAKRANQLARLLLFLVDAGAATAREKQELRAEAAHAAARQRADEDSLTQLLTRALDAAPRRSLRAAFCPTARLRDPTP